MPASLTSTMLHVCPFLGQFAYSSYRSNLSMFHCFCNWLSKLHHKHVGLILRTSQLRSSHAHVGVGGGGIMHMNNSTY